MTREEAIERFNGIINAMSISIAQSKFYQSKAELDELCDMAIEALSADYSKLLQTALNDIPIVDLTDGKTKLKAEDWVYDATPSAETVSRFHHDMEVKELKHQIKDQADMVSVVRCKDCKWYKACKVFSNNAWHDEDFCSWGERREL